ncbi:MAG TPA: hypothetical protein VG944_19605 [Fimbriimonas sp.]|nr:hypothetical protein [Fimbriimonas sp.]
MYKPIAHAVARHAHDRGWLDLRGGFRLLTDRRVSIGPKLASLGIGIAVTAALELFEVPLEAVVAVLLPLVGPVLDLAIDGAEFVLIPLLVASALMPRFARTRS